MHKQKGTVTQDCGKVPEEFKGTLSTSSSHSLNLSYDSDAEDSQN